MLRGNEQDVTAQVLPIGTSVAAFEPTLVPT
jgi:hypothetical protein